MLVTTRYLKDRRTNSSTESSSEMSSRVRRYRWWHQKLADYFQHSDDYERKIQVRCITIRSLLNFCLQKLQRSDAMQLRIVRSIGLLGLSLSRAGSWSLRALRLESKFSLWTFRGPKWSYFYFVNFRGPGHDASASQASCWSGPEPIIYRLTA